jgi:hypothetical protein
MKDFKLFTVAGLFGTLYALLLDTERGKEWIDEYTTVGVVLGVLGVLVALRTAQLDEEWQRTAGAFAAAGLPMVVCGVIRKWTDYL